MRLATYLASPRKDTRRRQGNQKTRRNRHRLSYESVGLEDQQSLVSSSEAGIAGNGIWNEETLFYNHFNHRLRPMGWMDMVFFHSVGNQRTHYS
jgi:hypothetical protein